MCKILEYYYSGCKKPDKPGPNYDEFAPRNLCNGRGPKNDDTRLVPHVVQVCDKNENGVPQFDTDGNHIYTTRCNLTLEKVYIKGKCRHCIGGSFDVFADENNKIVRKPKLTINTGQISSRTPLLEDETFHVPSLPWFDPGFRKIDWNPTEARETHLDYELDVSPTATQPPKLPSGVMKPRDTPEESIDYEVRPVNLMSDHYDENDPPQGRWERSTGSTPEPEVPTANRTVAAGAQPPPSPPNPFSQFNGHYRARQRKSSSSSSDSSSEDSKPLSTDDRAGAGRILNVQANEGSFHREQSVGRPDVLPVTPERAPGRIPLQDAIAVVEEIGSEDQPVNGEDAKDPFKRTGDVPQRYYLAENAEHERVGTTNSRHPTSPKRPKGNGKANQNKQQEQIEHHGDSNPPSPNDTPGVEHMQSRKRAREEDEGETKDEGEQTAPKKRSTKRRKTKQEVSHRPHTRSMGSPRDEANTHHMNLRPRRPPASTRQPGSTILNSAATALPTPRQRTRQAQANPHSRGDRARTQVPAPALRRAPAPIRGRGRGRPTTTTKRKPRINAGVQKKSRGKTTRQTRSTATAAGSPLMVRGARMYAMNDSRRPPWRSPSQSSLVETTGVGRDNDTVTVTVTGNEKEKSAIDVGHGFAHNSTDGGSNVE